MALNRWDSKPFLFESNANLWFLHEIVVVEQAN